MSLTAVLLVYSCTEEYWPELNSDYDQLLTVDGRITNEPGPYTIKLLKSSSIDTAIFKPILGARVSIIDKDGTSELLQSKGEGVYQTSPYGIQGIVGHEYKVSIEFNGKNYESSFEELLEPVGVESISAEWQLKNGATSNENEYGFQFYLTTETANNPINYLYWELSETYHYQSRFKTYLIYEGNGFTQPRNQDTVQNCWLTNVLDQRFTYTTKNLTTPKITNFPINFSPNSEKFELKYALLAKQYRVSENAYIFLSSLEDQNDVENTLYTSQPYQILGNIYNINDLDEPVLGYFLTAGVSSNEPVMVKRPRGNNIPVNWFTCDNPLRLFNTSDVIERVKKMPSSLWPIFLPSNPDAETPEPIIVDPGCVDCRERKKGGILQKPYYWDDNSLLIYDNNLLK